jgi:hypothetical protein
MKVLVESEFTVISYKGACRLLVLALQKFGVIFLVCTGSCADTAANPSGPRHRPKPPTCTETAKTVQEHKHDPEESEWSLRHPEDMWCDVMSQ